MKGREWQASLIESVEAGHHGLGGDVAVGDRFVHRLTDKTAGEIVAMPFGRDKAPRATALIGNTGHLQEHYGNLVTYFRIKGLVPPSSRPSK